MVAEGPGANEGGEGVGRLRGPPTPTSRVGPPRGPSQRPGAGSSAAAQARRLRSPLVRLADLVGIQTARGRQAKQWDAGAAGEKATAERLKSLAWRGWTVLHDRALLTGRANVDHLVVSRTGVVFVVDSKRWSARYRLRGVAGRLLHGQVDVTERLRGIRHEVRSLADALGCPCHLDRLHGGRPDRWRRAGLRRHPHRPG
ncbi:nuclease-related domain-containing protein [Streptomyces sp. NPDC057565]|uniref:nuclease-related domain-containing protein n=1 Tax=Streptomyces sp. NPDC057565 TaxID=3346169 RepID=UPI0036933400